MTSQEVLTITIIFALLFVIWYLTARKKSQPNRLHLNRKTSLPPLAPEDIRPSDKNLNVMFMFNGHAWDAYEVLGVPAGSSFEKVKDAYESEMKSESSELKEFTQLAYDAIKRENKC